MPEKIEPVQLTLVAKTMAATQRLADQRNDVSAHADRLNNCIERFEEWVKAIPGRVETILRLPVPFEDLHPEAPDHELHVKVSRDGKDWRIFWGYWLVGDEDGVPWKPLREAGLDLKLYVIPKLPDLILEMAEEQSRLKARIDDVATSFEDFARRIGMPNGGK